MPRRDVTPLPPCDSSGQPSSLLAMALSVSLIAAGKSVAVREKIVSFGSGRMHDVATVYESCFDDLYGYALSLTRSPASAEDVVHEAFARLVAAGGGEQQPENPRAWLYTVATNLAFSHSRRRAIVERWQQLVGRAMRDETGEAAEDTVLRSERNAELSAALGSLPKDHRAALLLAADGFSGKEIASILRRSEGATRKILWRARVALRDRLEAGGAA